MNLNWESGFRRLTTVLSILIGAVGLFFVAVESNRWMVLGIFSVLAAMPWLLFYTVRWVAHGFRTGPVVATNAAQNTEPPAPSPTNAVPVEETKPTPPSVSTPTIKTDGRLQSAFWPTIRTEADAQKCLQLGAGSALFVGSVTGVLSIIALLGYPLLGMTGVGIFDAAMFLALAYGTNKGNRLAASGGFSFYMFQVVVQWLGAKPRFNIMQVMLLLWFASGIRGAFHLRKDSPLLNDLPSWRKKAFKAVAATGLAVIGISFLLTCEWFINKTLLGRPGYKWTTKSIPNQELVSTARDYKLSFKGARLDWRSQYDVAKEGHDLNHFFVGYPGLLLAVWEESGDLSQFSDEQLIVTKLGFSGKEKNGKKVVGAIDVSRAVKGKFFILEDAAEKGAEKMLSIMGVYRSPKKLVTLRFVPYSPTDGTPVSTTDADSDIKLISNSFEFSN